jgi:hypothetical protein
MNFEFLHNLILNRIVDPNQTYETDQIQGFAPWLSQILS